MITKEQLENLARAVGVAQGCLEKGLCVMSGKQIASAKAALEVLEVAQRQGMAASTPQFEDDEPVQPLSFEDDIKSKDW